MDIQYGIDHGKNNIGDYLLWHLKGPKGAIHVWAQFYDKGVEPIFGQNCYGGIEVHHKSRPGPYSPEKAPIEDCWLTGCDCWPDGSSLYFSETLMPTIVISKDDPSKVTDWVNGIMLEWYEEKFGASA